MLAVIGGVLVLIICFGPMAWARMIMGRHTKDRRDFPGAGGEFVRHILDLADLRNVGVKTTTSGDYYSPAEKVVRLSKENFDDRSLTAVAVAAHEVGHALQDRDGYRPLTIRTRLANVAF